MITFEKTLLILCGILVLVGVTLVVTGLAKAEERVAACKELGGLMVATESGKVCAKLTVLAEGDK